MDEYSDQTLIEETLGGSRIAFDRLMVRYGPMVYRLGYSYTRNREDAMDLTQNAFLKVYTRLHTYRGEGSFQAWLLRLAHREGLNWLRRHRKYREWTELSAENPPSEAPRQETALLQAERREHVWRWMAELNPKQRLALSLRYFVRAPVKEIAATLQCSEGTAKSILFRGLSNLRQKAAHRWRKVAS